MASEICLNPADIHNTAPSYWVILPNSSHLAGRIRLKSYRVFNADQVEGILTGIGPVTVRLPKVRSKDGEVEYRGE